jgi:TetR/AcrR family transcriptional regulator, regulator of cefoperazone and chloramphenicol sensitivity
VIPSTKEKILAATLELIKAEGLEGVTIRKIAGLAGANVALVNYYFGSKEKLISETLKLQLTSFREAFSVFDETDLTPLVRLKRFLLTYTNSLQEHPELIKRLIGQEQQFFESQTEYAEFFKHQGFDKLSATLTEITGNASRDMMLLMSQQMFAAILSPIIKNSFARKHQWKDEGDFRIYATVEEQIDLFLNHYFHQYNAR